MTGQRDYGRTWRRFWGAVVAVSLAPAALVVHPAVLLASGTAGALVAVVASLVLSADVEDSVANRLTRLRVASVWGASTVAATVVVGTVSSSLLLWGLLAALVSSPAAVTPARKAFTQLSGPSTDGADELPPDRTDHELLVNLSSADLCQAWRSTHRRLLLAQTAPEVAAYARLRRTVLEELERRHPREVAAWLAAGGSAEQGPTVLSRGRRGSGSAPESSP